MSLVFFKMLDARIHDLFDAVQLLREKLLHGVEALIHMPDEIVEAFSEIIKPFVIEYQGRDRDQRRAASAYDGRCQVGIQGFLLPVSDRFTQL